MMESLLELGISNAIISLAIAFIAIIVGRFTNRPHLAHLLWLLVLAKLLMPAIIPVSYSTGAKESIKSSSTLIPVDSSRPIVSNFPESQLADKSSIALYDILPMAQSFGLTYLPAVWGLGALIALAFSLFRVVRFDRLLRSSSKPANSSIYQVAKGLSVELSLSKLPSIKMTSAEISPMVWWVGRRVEIFIPQSLIESMETSQLRLVIAHELAHVKRRDFLVRWLEWSAAILFWWNPVVWWAQRNLRANEEICCDALVLSKLKPKPQEYAAALLSAVEKFATPASRPPAMASEVNSGGYLIRRIHMILSSNNKQKLSRKIQIAVLTVAALVLPMGLTIAQDQESEAETEKRVKTIKEEVKAGKKSKREAEKEIREIEERIRIRVAKRKLDAAVKAGKMSREIAEKRLESIRRSENQKLHRSEQLKEAIEETKAAQKAGKISSEEAKTRLHKLKLHAQEKEHEMNLRRVAEKLMRAVEANKISQAEAKAQLRAAKKQVGEFRRNRNHQFATEKLKRAVEAKSISILEAQRKMLKLQREFAASYNAEGLRRVTEQIQLAVRENKISQAEAEAKIRAFQLQLAEEASSSRVNGASQELKLALEAGRISKEAAAKRMKELKLRHSHEQRLRYFRRAQEKLESAVKSGKMTEEEAKAKLIEIEKKLKKKKSN